MFQWLAILPWATVPSVWLPHASGTVCLLSSLRLRRCWFSDNCLRQNCTAAAFLTINTLSCDVRLNCDCDCLTLLGVLVVFLTLRHLNLFVYNNNNNNTILKLSNLASKASTLTKSDIKTAGKTLLNVET